MVETPPSQLLGKKMVFGSWKEIFVSLSSSLAVFAQKAAPLRRWGGHHLERGRKMNNLSKLVPGVLATFAVVVALALAPDPAAATECARKGGGGGCYPTIQEAVDAASPGETVNIFPGTYHEAVGVTTPGLKLVGKGSKPTAVRIDGSRLSAIGIDIRGVNDVLVKNLTVRGTAGQGILSAGNGVTVSRVKVFASGGPCVQLIGENNRVLGTAVRGCGGPGIQIDGTGGLVSSSSVAIAGDGIYVQGDNGRVVSSRVSQVTSGIRVDGPNGEVRSNRVDLTTGPGIMVDGNSTPVNVVGNTVLDASAPGIMVVGLSGVGAAVGEVSGNVVTGAMGDGISVECSSSCDGSSVADNRVSRVRYGSGIHVTAGAAGLLVRNNLAVSNPAFGFMFDGIGLKVLGNTAKGNGIGYRGLSGFMINGIGHEVRQNVAIGNVSDGIQLEGTGFVAVKDNIAQGNYGNGIVVGGGSSGMPLTGNTARGNYVLGIHVESGAVGTTLTSCTAKSNNGYDFCDQAASTIIGAGNSFSTTCP